MCHHIPCANVTMQKVVEHYSWRQPGLIGGLKSKRFPILTSWSQKVFNGRGSTTQNVLKDNH